MAIALESQSNVWRKVEAYFNSHDGGSASPAAVNAFRALKAYLVSTANATQLQFVPFSAAQIVVNLGYSPDVDSCQVYGWYAKNTGGSDGTDSFIALHNAANNASAGITLGLIQDDDREIIQIYPQGLDFATELTVSGATTAFGATESAEADAADGFVILGDA